MTNYTDNIKVKISERYKPPPRINLVVSYAQRLKLNKQIQDNIPDYNFSKEIYVLEKMKEWKENKSIILNERQSKLKLKIEQLEEAKKKALEDIEVTLENDSSTLSNSADNSTDITVKQSDYVNTVMSTGNTIKDTQVNMEYTIPSNAMLIPTQASNNYANILKPTQLPNYGIQLVKETDKKSTFNLSDFEYDTSSPFDNMELKTINDLEELAQVLNKEDNDQKLKNNPSLYSQANDQSFHNVVSQPSTIYNNYLQNGYSGNQYFSNIPITLSSVRPNNLNYIYSNGYRYPTEYTQFNQEYHTPYTWDKRNNDYLSSLQSADTGSKNSKCKSIPDLVNALEIELENNHLSELPCGKSFEKSRFVAAESKPKYVDVSALHKKTQSCTEEHLNFLTKDEQDLCKSISVMGFPIERVARVYRLLGNDEKKIVEHLLAMSDLLDLGFHEKDVSNALFECDNDRDKALDKLIT